ncbi:DNA methylase [uncultured Desulfobacter sp.]|uniref:DNA methylase n=1 Tax=uncultured Desulfobacter sp. TaxID=240139 RepID=UPI0029C63293|nr:DNA methylase [uncultured Desulfobacter sp.]
MERLLELETLIGHNQESFYKIGQALKEIRDNRLYTQALFESFEAYTRERWDMGKSHAYRLIKFYEVIYNLSPIGDRLPANESQARPLTQLDSIEQRRIWKAIINSGMELTARNIKKFIESQKTVSVSKPDLTDQITNEYMAIVKAMLEQVRVAQHDHWQKTSRQAALLWHRVIYEKIVSKGADNG